MRIGITTQEIYHPNYAEPGYFLSRSWHDFFTRIDMDLVPLHSLRQLNEEITENRLDGAILSGGGDISEFFPLNSQGSHRKNNQIPERELIEASLIEICLLNKLPLIGVCRGMQAIGLYFGLKLFGVPGHVKTQHRVDFYCPITNLSYQRNLNSFHNFGFHERHLTEAFQCHISIDGIVEFMTGYQNTFLGIMWHPERYKIFEEHDVTLFRTFFGEKI